MSEQPEALRLADIIEKSDANFYGESTLWFDGELSEALPVWQHFVGLSPKHHQEFVRAIERHHGITKDQP